MGADCGILIDGFDVDAMASAVVRLLRDACLRETIGGRARAKVAKEYASDVIGSRMAAIFDALLRGSGDVAAVESLRAHDTEPFLGAQK